MIELIRAAQRRRSERMVRCRPTERLAVERYASDRLQFESLQAAHVDCARLVAVGHATQSEPLTAAD